MQSENRRTRDKYCSNTVGEPSVDTANAVAANYDLIFETYLVASLTRMSETPGGGVVIAGSSAQSVDRLVRTAHWWLPPVPR
jgi:hypothetical protein